MSDLSVGIGTGILRKGGTYDCTTGERRLSNSEWGNRAGKGRSYADQSQALRDWRVRTGPIAPCAGWRAFPSGFCHKDRSRGSSKERCASRPRPEYRDCLCIPESRGASASPRQIRNLSKIERSASGAGRLRRFALRRNRSAAACGAHGVVGPNSPANHDHHQNDRDCEIKIAATGAPEASQRAGRARRQRAIPENPWLSPRNSRPFLALGCGLTSAVEGALTYRPSDSAATQLRWKRGRIRQSTVRPHWRWNDSATEGQLFPTRAERIDPAGSRLLCLPQSRADFRVACGAAIGARRACPCPGHDGR